MQNISSRVLTIRERLKLSQADFAKRMRYGRHYVSMIERGVALNPSPRFLEQLEMLEREADIDDCSSKERLTETNMHQPLPERESRIKDEAALFGKPQAPAIDFAACIKMLTELHERSPQAFDSAAAMIKGLYDIFKK